MVVTANPTANDVLWGFGRQAQILGKKKIEHRGAIQIVSNTIY